MFYRLILSPRANKYLKKLERSVKQRIDGTLFELQKNPYTHNIKFLKDERTADFRVRVGDYRIIYDIYEEDKIIYIIKI